MTADAISKHAGMVLTEFLDAHILLGWTPNGELIMNGRIPDKKTAHHISLVLCDLLNSHAISGMVPPQNRGVL